MGDTTLDILNYTPDLVIDEEEDEVFIGPKTLKELRGEQKYSRRKTIVDWKPGMKTRVSQSPISEEEEAEEENRCPNIPDIINSLPMKKSPSNGSDSEDVVVVSSPMKKPSVGSDSENVIISSPMKKLSLGSDPKEDLSSERSAFSSTERESSTKASSVGFSSPSKDNEEREEISILDIRNDQIFDDSVFTEYDEKDLSAMSDKMMGKWRKRLKKKKPEEKETKKDKEYPDESAGFEEWFGSERDIFILIELFGTESYDTIVEKMTYEEKKALKDKVSKMIPKTVEELKAMYPDDDEEDEENDEKHDFRELFNSSRDELILFDMLGINYDDIVNAMNLEERLALKAKVDKMEPKPAEEILAMLPPPFESDKKAQRKKERLSIIAMGNSLVPKPRSPLKPVPKPRTTTTTPNTTPFKIPTTPSYLRPIVAYTQKDVLSPRKDQSPNNKVSSSPRIRKGSQAIDMSKIVSPVAQYIHNHPAPPIMRVIKPTEPNKQFYQELKSSSVQKARSPNVGSFAPIPEATYKSSRLAKEQEIESDFESEKELSKRFGTLDKVDVKVIRHVGRVKVPSQWNKEEEFLQEMTTESSGSKTIGRPVLKKVDRDSVMPDGTMIDMSLHEIKPIQKVNSLTRKK